MIIYNWLTGLRPRLLRSYTPVVIIHAASSCVTVVQCSSSRAIQLVWARSWASIWNIPSSASSRLVGSTGAAIDIMNIFLESVCYFSLVLFSLTTILALSVFRCVARLVIRPIIICLPPSWISRVNMKVLFRGLSTHFISWVFGLSNRAWGLHARTRSSSPSRHCLSMRPILLNNIDCLFHGWGALATTSSIALRGYHIRLYDIVRGRNGVIRSVSAIVLIVPMWWFIMKVRITIQIGVSIRLFNLLAGGQFLQISDARLEALNALFLSSIPVSMSLGLLVDVHGVMPGGPLWRLMMIWWRVALIMVISTAAIASSICFSLHFD